MSSLSDRPAKASTTPAGHAARSEHVGQIIAMTCLVFAVVLTALVAVGTTHAFDERVRSWFRPHDVWGQTQIRADLVVEGLRPTHALVLLVAVTAFACLRRHSWRPALLSGMASLIAIAATYAGKLLVERSDPHGQVAGGSYPSGHTLSIMVCVGLCVTLLVGSRALPWALLAASLAGVVMGTALLLQAAHWATDVIGAALIALAVVAFAATSPTPAHHPWRPGAERES